MEIYNLQSVHFDPQNCTFFHYIRLFQRHNAFFDEYFNEIKDLGLIFEIDFLKKSLKNKDLAQSMKVELHYFEAYVISVTKVIYSTVL